MHEKLMKFLKCTNKMKEIEGMRNNRRETKLNHNEATYSTYHITDLFVPLTQVGTQVMQNQLKIEELQKLGMFEKSNTPVHKRKQHKKDNKTETEKEIDPLNFFQFINDEVTSKNTSGNNLAELNDESLVLQNSNLKNEKTEEEIKINSIPIVLKLIKKKLHNTNNIASTYEVSLQFESLLCFYPKFNHDTSCELLKHFKNNLDLSSLKLDAEEEPIKEKSVTTMGQCPSQFSVSTCALRYIKMDSPSNTYRNKVQIKYKQSDNSGLITIVESLNNPIDYVLLGKLICHLLGIENVNENLSS